MVWRDEALRLFSKFVLILDFFFSKMPRYIIVIGISLTLVYEGLNGWTDYGRTSIGIRASDEATCAVHCTYATFPGACFHVACGLEIQAVHWDSS